jgi:hypothetical protein
MLVFIFVFVFVFVFARFLGTESGHENLAEDSLMCGTSTAFCGESYISGAPLTDTHVTPFAFEFPDQRQCVCQDFRRHPTATQR